MYELEQLGFRTGKASLVSSPDASRDGQPWEFVGGIQFDRTATIYAPDGIAVLHVKLPRPQSMTSDPDEAYRTVGWGGGVRAQNNPKEMLHILARK
jgi:hypothetical protein